MKPHPADRMDVTAALHHSWTCVPNPTLEGPVPAEHDPSSEIIEETSIVGPQLCARASYVSSDANVRSHLKLGTAAMPQTPEYCNINNLENEDAAVRSTGVETAGKKLDRLEKKLDPQEQLVEVQKRVLGEEHADTLQSMHTLAFSYYSQGQYR